MGNPNRPSRLGGLKYAFAYPVRLYGRATSMELGGAWNLREQKSRKTWPKNLLKSLIVSVLKRALERVMHWGQMLRVRSEFLGVRIWVWAFWLSRKLPSGLPPSEHATWRYSVRRFFDGAIADGIICGNLYFAFLFTGMSLIQRIHDFWGWARVYEAVAELPQGSTPLWAATFYFPLSIGVSALVASGATTLVRVKAPSRVAYIAVRRWLLRHGGFLAYKVIYDYSLVVERKIDGQTKVFRGGLRIVRRAWLRPWTWQGKLLRFTVNHSVDWGLSVGWTALAWLLKGYWTLLTPEALMADVVAGKLLGTLIAREMLRKGRVSPDRYDQRIAAKYDQRQLKRMIADWYALVITPSFFITLARRMAERPAIFAAVDPPVWEVAIVFAIQVVLGITIAGLWIMRCRRKGAPMVLGWRTTIIEERLARRE